MGDFRAAEYMRGKKSLEINFEHPMIRNLNANYQTDERNAKVRIQRRRSALDKNLLEVNFVCSDSTSS